MKRILATLILAGFTGVFTLVPSLGRFTFGIGSATASGKPSSSRPVHPINHRAEEAWFYGQRAAPRRTIPARAWLRAHLQRTHVRRRNHVHGYALGIWTQIGPAPTGTGNDATSGRVSALAYDPVHNILYAGAAEGGLWKSANGGTTWTPLTDDQPSLAVGSIALDPSCDLYSAIAHPPPRLWRSCQASAALSPLRTAARVCSWESRRQRSSCVVVR
jgi:hypothetical protein